MQKKKESKPITKSIEQIEIQTIDKPRDPMEFSLFLADHIIQNILIKRTEKIIHEKFIKENIAKYAMKCCLYKLSSLSGLSYVVHDSIDCGKNILERPSLEPVRY